MRFDDSLDTVLSADMSSQFGAQSAWRQLVDLIGRGRAAADPQAIAQLQTIRLRVPTNVRASSARALAFATPPAALVRLFSDDEIAVAGPVLRAAQLRASEWVEMLPGMSPAARSVLRHRRDLSPEVRRALDAFGTVDFRLGSPAEDAIALQPEPSTANAAQPVALEDDTSSLFRHGPAKQSDSVRDTTAETMINSLASPPPTEPLTPDVPFVHAPEADNAFVSVGKIALGLPVVAEALRHAESTAAEATPPLALVASTHARGPLPQAQGPFQISELVARIDAYQRQRDDAPATLPRGEHQPALFNLTPVQASTFRFETDAVGMIRWIEGAARAPLIGLTLGDARPGNDHSGGQVDGIAAGAFRRRAGFANARLVVDGNSDAAGQWRITALPVFDRESGRFTGYRGTARRPRVDESAEPLRHAVSPTADSLRQLVHELRTPTNAIAGFAEMIETQLLGPVPQVYRDQASTIRDQASGLITAIDDIDLAARLESHALDLRNEVVPLGALLVRVARDLAPLATLRGTDVMIDPGAADLAIAGDEVAVERLIGRLMSTLIASGGQGETINIVAGSSDSQITLAFDRPVALAAFGNDAILTIDAEAVAEADGAPLLGTGFALRLARNLATELGGALTIDASRLTLRLPAAVTAEVGHISSN